MAYTTQFQKTVARTFLNTELTLQQVANRYGVAVQTVRAWAMRHDPHKYAIATGKNRQLLIALDILESRPNIRMEELAKLSGVSRRTIGDWNQKGKITLDIQCDICGEPTTTKYCTSCKDKGWHVYASKMIITHDELCSLPTSCEVCGSEESLAVDHDHNTGKYRGVLCRHCNVALGMAMDDITTLTRLIEYLKTKK